MRKKNNAEGFVWLVAWRVLILSAIASLSLSSFALAVPNNGFDTDYIYCRTNDKQDQWPRYHGSIRVFNELTGQHIKLIQPQGADWSSLTFAGTGNDDARLFVAKQVDLDTNDLYEDVLIAELDNTCEVTDPYDPSQCPPTNTVYLSALLGASPGDDIVVGWGSLRYSMYHNSLFLGVNPNRDANPYPATIYEVNLALDTVLNTYTAGNITEETGVALDINGHNGDVYITNRTLLSASGGLVKVDTVDPDKGAVTTLIDGSRLAGEWTDHGPKFVVYRNNNNLEAAQTVLIVFYDTGGGTAGEFVVEEYYLEQTGGNGDLLKRQDAYNGRRGAGAGQLDEYSGSVFTTRWWPANPAGNAGADEYKADDVHYRAPFDKYLNNILYNNGFFDVDSPGFLNINVLPISEQTSLAYTGDPADPSSIKYVVINKGYAFSGNVNYSVVESPEVGWLSLSKTGGGPIPPADSDTVNANIDTSSLPGGIYTTNLVFTDENNTSNQFTRTITLTVKDCDWEITPDSTSSLVPGDITVWGGCTSPQGYQFVVSNVAGADLSYTVEEVDGPDPVTANPTDYTWLDLDKTTAGPIAAGFTDTVTVTVTSDNTVKSAYLRFTPSCGGIPTLIRKIEVTTLTETGEDKAFKHIYLGDRDPLDADSCGFIPPDTLINVGGCKFEIEAAVGAIPTAIGTTVDDDDAQNGKAFYINNLSIDSGRHGYRSHTTDNSGIIVRNYLASRLGFTMVARLKVIENQNTGAVIWTWSQERDPGGGYTLPKAGWNMTWHGGGPNAVGRLREYQFTSLPEEVRVSEQLDANPEASDYHILRVVNGFGHYGERVFMVYYDEDPEPAFIIDDPPGTANGSSYDSFCFGTFGSSARGEVYWDWISFTNKGMYAPGEEDDCIGTLIPEFLPPCNDPFADVDGPDINGDGKPDGDGDVDQDDFAEFQVCYTGEGDPGGVFSEENCGCFDQEPAGGDDDVDELDWGKFEACASGPNVPADISCDDPAP